MTENRLINEKSPYLLQHARNPVNWRPWSDAAFEEAAAADKPVFLSIGYATCHWCHVMEKESFEDAEAARHLNDTFICVKVDREERPDVDAVYMAACQMLTGAGGWPLTLFLTPDRKPFFAATYLPRTSRGGRAGLIDLCVQVKRLWDGERKKLLDSAGAISGNIGQAFSFISGGHPDEGLLRTAFDQLEGRFDPNHGGFSQAPKFPTPHNLRFLLRWHRRNGSEKARAMVERTLAAMRMGGIWDHVGFGFHRYSTDRFWLLPHFEKMLYDQALMATALLDAWQVTGRRDHAETAESIFTYALRDMTDPDGPFYAAEDADSEGEEGRFYVWTQDEFIAALGREEAGFWMPVFNVKPEGNFLEEATGRPAGANIPHLTKPFSEWAETLNTDPEALAARWEAARGRLFSEREKRPRPLLDDKVLTDWNGLMIAALARGGRLLDRPEWIAAADRAARFIRERMTASDGRLLHRYRDGEAAIDGNANDYAFFIRGLLGLYRSTFDPEHLAAAIDLQRRMIDDFGDDAGGGFFLTRADAADLPARPRELYDGAQPSANSVALANLLALARLTGEAHWEARAHALVEEFAGTVKSHPSAYTAYLSGVDFSLGPSLEVVVIGAADADDTRRMLAAANRVFAPNATVMLKTPENADRLAGLAPFTSELKSENGAATAYVCSNFACERPTTDPDEMARRISG